MNKSLCLPFAIVGAGGRMGRTIISLSQVFNDGAMLLCGALESNQSSDIGRDAGEVAGTKTLSVKLSSEYNEALKNAKVVIDFSSPETSMGVVNYCLEQKISCVIGTTGFTERQKELIFQASQDIPILLASNMSLGVSLLSHLVKQSVRFLGPEYDVEISEIHHRYKKDAPSGTALSLCDALNINPSTATDYEIKHGRQGNVGERSKRELGVHALRGGDVVGDHTVYFMGDGERIELTHRASSRSAFGMGALRAGKFFAEEERQAKMYTLNDILGLTGAF